MLALALTLLAQAHAAMPAPSRPDPQVCPAAAAIPRELAGWRTMTPVAARDTPAVIRVGQAARASLLPTAAVTYPLAPARPAAANTSGGVFAFEVARAGTYRVALGAGAWIDVVQGGKALASTAHAHGPDCSPVRKTVDFRLTPGRYLAQIVGSPAPVLELMVARLR
ncbi:homogentisate 1,2-dioxygenase [Sphingomonas sp.]|uniref:homogentisate 1,2-dioxygenase n=1 Tax=Sphingomonas sp. TaxID=28214 RepID=UPI0035BC6306